MAKGTEMQKLCLPQENDFPQELYFRSTGKQISGEKRNTCQTGVQGYGQRKCLRILQGERVTFDTYFNLFPLFKWRTYTRISDLTITIHLKGNALVSLMGIYFQDAFGNEERGSVLAADVQPENKTVQSACTLREKEITLYCGHVLAKEEGSVTIPITGELSGLPDFLYLAVEACESDAILYDIVYSTSSSLDEKLNLACCFCTYKREKDIRQNIDNLLSGIVHRKDSALSGNLQIYVADNGQTLPEDLYADEPAVHIFPNKNYGGSAGFTRCMIEACFHNTGKPFTHLILMDDDALILPEVVERTAAFVGLLREEYQSYMIGGGLLDKEKPAIQEENGAFLALGRAKITSCGHRLDLRSRENVLENECSLPSAVNYNGWWYTCIPTRMITKENLPLPCFLHRDDEEYGIRNGGKFIRINGICVWHPNLWGITKTKPYMNYYGWRNILMAQAAHDPKQSTKMMLTQFARAVAAHLLNYNYAGTRYLCRGFEDFYKGIDAFKRRDAQKLNVRLVKKESYETCRLKQQELKKAKHSWGKQYAKNGGKPLFSREQLRTRKILNWLLPATKKRVVYSDGHTWEELDYYRAKEVWIVNSKTGEGIRMRKDYKEAFACILYSMRVFLRIAKTHRKVYSEWAKRISELQSYEFWEKYLEL